jgi:hypothetical protein
MPLPSWPTEANCLRCPAHICRLTMSTAPRTVRIVLSVDVRTLSGGGCTDGSSTARGLYACTEAQTGANHPLHWRLSAAPSSQRFRWTVRPRPSRLFRASWGGNGPCPSATCRSRPATRKRLRFPPVASRLPSTLVFVHGRLRRLQCKLTRLWETGACSGVRSERPPARPRVLHGVKKGLLALARNFVVDALLVLL